jgi:hypothetical protein
MQGTRFDATLLFGKEMRLGVEMMIKIGFVRLSRDRKRLHRLVTYPSK